MTSKGLFFKYMRENTKQRLWSVALTALLCFFLFPVLTALEISIMLRPDNLSKDLSVEAALAEAKLKLTDVEYVFDQECNAGMHTDCGGSGAGGVWFFVSPFEKENGFFSQPSDQP